MYKISQGEYRLSKTSICQRIKLTSINFDLGVAIKQKATIIVNMSAILRPRILLPLRKILQLPSYGHSSHGRLSQAWLSLSKHAYSVRVQNNPESKCMDVTWEDGVTTNFPHLYLRDHCRCPSCFDPQTKSRVIFNSIYNSYLDSAAKDVNLSQDQQTIQVDWENDEQHPVSRFPVEWLRAHRFPTQDEISAMSRIYLKDRHTWGKELSGHIPEFDCQQLHQDDETLYRWLKCLTTVGLSIVKNVPREKGQVNKLINRVGYIRTTNYG